MKFLDEVIIKDKFYKEAKGYIIDYELIFDAISQNRDGSSKRYLVQFITNIGNIQTWFNENNLNLLVKE